MIQHPDRTDLFLVKPEEVDGHVEGLEHEEVDSMRAMLQWSREYLFKGSSKLGRRGPVCPFVKPALTQHRSMYLTSIRTPDLDTDAVARKLYGYRDWFGTLSPTGPIKKHFKTILVLLPDLNQHADTESFIESIHEKLKPDWIDMGLMLGQFYPSCNAEGLHNADYRPLRSPRPLFVMRNMQLTDLPFLLKNEHSISSYCRNFKVRNRHELENRISEAQIPKMPRNWEECMTTVFGGTSPMLPG